MKVMCKNDFLKKVRRLYFYRCMIYCLCFLLLNTRDIWANVENQSLTLQLKEASLKELFQLMEKQSNYRFLYESDAIGQIRVKNINAVELSVNSILDYCLSETGFTYEVDGNLILIKEAREQTLPQKVEKIEGVVKDPQGVPLPGVTVMIDGTTVGVTTNANGKFEIAKPASGKFSLFFTFIGMKSQTVPYKGENFFQIVMEEDIYELEAVNVVETGYGTIDRRHLTSSVTSVRAEDILVPGMSSIDQALEGRIPDLVLMSNSGEVGATPKIRVRGTSTILGNREPLWVLDGIVLTAPVDIEPE